MSGNIGHLCNLVSTRKRKCIGTRKHNSEAVEGTKREQRNEDLDGPSNGHFLVNVQETTLQTTGGPDECTEQPALREYNVATDAGSLNRDPIGMHWWAVEEQPYDDVSVMEKTETSYVFV